MKIRPKIIGRDRGVELIMSNAERTPSHRPTQGTKLEPLHRALAIQFHPPIKLESAKGLQFASKLSSAIDPRGVELQENKWEYSQPSGSHPAGQFTISVTDSRVQIETMFPTETEESFEHKAGYILTEFEKFFKPELLLGSDAIIRATIQIDGDARTFLAEHVTHFDMARLKPLNRPVHAFGIRLMMPAFKMSTTVPKKKTGRTTAKKPKANVGSDWSVDVKAESYIEDPSKLFLEAQAQWQEPHPWTKSSRETATGRLATVSKFITTNFIPFLTNQSEGED